MAAPVRRRLRPAYDAAQLAEIYRAHHVHTQWRDHVLRVAVTVQVAKWFTGVTTVADLSCGDAAITTALGVPQTILGDYAPGYPHQGPIEETINQIRPVDLFICSETLEHLDDPDAVLHAIRAKTRYLVLSTPDGEDDDRNPEHYWGWNTAAVEGMLRTAGFIPEVLNVLQMRGLHYDYQIWGCR